MIPFFYRTYRKAPLATFISLLSSGCYLLTALFTIGYFMNWSGLKDEMQLGESLLVAGSFLVVGILFMKWAAWLAKRKYEKLAQAEAASRQATPSWANRPASGQANTYSRPASEQTTTYSRPTPEQTTAYSRSTSEQANTYNQSTAEQATVNSRPAEQAASYSRPAAEAGATNAGRSVRFCPKCGAKADADDVFCVSSGAKLRERDAAPQAQAEQTQTQQTYTSQPQAEKSYTAQSQTYTTQAQTTQSQTTQAYASQAQTAQPPAQEAPKKRGNVAVRLLVTLAIVGLAYGGGKLLGGQMSKTYTPSTAAITPVPLATLAVPQVTLAVPQTQFGSGVQSTGAGWDLSTATDLDIRLAMSNYFAGENDLGFGALFMDAAGDHGGVICTSTSDQYKIEYFGTWSIPEDANEPLILTDANGVRHEITIEMEDENKLRIKSADYNGHRLVFISMLLERGEFRKEDVYQLMRDIRDYRTSY